MEETFILILSALPFDPTSTIDPIISFHQPKIKLEPIEEKSFYVIHYSFDSFPRAGFYDWKIVRIQNDGNFRTIFSNPIWLQKSLVKMTDPLTSSPITSIPI